MTRRCRCRGRRCLFVEQRDDNNYVRTLLLADGGSRLILNTRTITLTAPHRRTAMYYSTMEENGELLAHGPMIDDGNGDDPSPPP